MMFISSSVSVYLFIPSGDFEFLIILIYFLIQILWAYFVSFPISSIFF